MQSKNYSFSNLAPTDGQMNIARILKVVFKAFLMGSEDH